MTPGVDCAHALMAINIVASVLIKEMLLFRIWIALLYHEPRLTVLIACRVISRAREYQPRYFTAPYRMKVTFQLHSDGTVIACLRLLGDQLSTKVIRVLVAEDDEVNAKAARLMLERLGCVVDVATDGNEAVNQFRAQDYDLILMDWQMPLMDGIEATAHIRAMPGGQATPIIGTTAANAHTECLRSGMNDVVPKPFVLDKLRSVLSRWTGWTAAPKTGACEA